jgi:Xaa-Pro dipeptidase
LTLEFAGAYRRYHACLMRTICIGRIPDRQRDMWHACHEALPAAMDALKPGFPIGQVFDAHARVLDGAGFRQHRLNA